MNEDSLFALLSIMLAIVVTLLILVVLANAADCWQNYARTPLQATPARCMYIKG